ncbi:MAG: fructosamine kinase family protein [Petrimonas sp.]|jgi:fructosamine-3-kinase
MNNIIEYICEKIAEKIISYHSVTGGDISSAFLLKSEKRNYFLKVNSKPFAYTMFHTERAGLEAIAKTKTIAVPHIYLVDSFQEKSFLLMDFVESKRPDSSDFSLFGTQLAKMHQHTQSEFGFYKDNFIGSLPQSNTFHDNWAEFYWFERIFSQLQLAKENGLLSASEIPNENRAIDFFQYTFGDVKPSLLHGDLWGGNYLIASNGIPFLIDPATYFGHSMVDIAISKLFGGFSQSFYDAYHEIIPKPDNYLQQIELYQLYYLLVHLNLFGSGYYSSVSHILKRYF